MTRFVLDSFAMLAYYWDEPGARRVEQVLDNRSHRRWMSTINLGEVYYQTVKRAGSAGDEAGNEVLNDMLSLSVSYARADMPLVLNAARLKARYPISYADSFAAALARQLDATLLTGDPEFAPLERDGVVRVEWLRRR